MTTDAQTKADRLALLVTNRLQSARQWRGSQQVLGKSISTWLSVTHRAINKIHEPEELAAFPGMKGYFGLTMLKVNATVAKLKTTYAHAIDAPFVFRASAEPELSSDSQKRVEDKLRLVLQTRMADAGLQPRDLMGVEGLKPPVHNWLERQRDTIRAAVLEEERNVAELAAGYHHGFLRKQLLDGGWVNASSSMFVDLVTKPYTVICAGEQMPRWDLRWDGNKPTRKLVLSPAWRHVAAENAYIGSDATSAQDGSGFSEIVMRTRGDLVELGKLKDAKGKPLYMLEQIEAVLMNHENQPLDWLGMGELGGSPIGRDRVWSSNPSEKVRCVVHQGTVSGAELEEFGYTGYGDEAEFHEVLLEVCANTTIRIQIGDGRRTYYSASYKKSSDSYAGVSVAMMLHDRQLEVNRLLLAKNRNAWHASGPNVMMNGHYFQHPEDVKLEPFSVAWANPKNTTGQSWGMQQVNVQPMFAALHEEIRRIMVLADEEGGVPSLFSGMSRGGVSRTTLGGAVLEQTSGEMGMNDAIVNLDKGIIEPMVLAQHYDNLQRETTRKYIRGDIEIEGRGIYGLREKELQQRLAQQAMPMLMQTTQAGLTPQPMLEGELKNYYSNVGFNTSTMQGTQAKQEIANYGLNPQQKPDGRTFNPQQSTLGVMQ